LEVRKWKGGRFEGVPFAEAGKGSQNAN